MDPSKVRTTFVILANEVVISALGGALIRLLRREAPLVELRFMLESPDDLQMLRDGRAALAIGSYGGLTADLHTETLATERMVSVMRAGHPLAGRRVTSARFAALEHIVTSRRGIARGPIDDALALQGRERRIAAVVPSFSAALALCMDSDLVTIAPRRLARRLAGPSGLVEFRSPVKLPTVEVDIVWHARVDADPIHRWLRTCIRRVAVEPTR